MYKDYSNCIYCKSKLTKKFKHQTFRDNFYTSAIRSDLNISKSELLKMKLFQCQKCFIIQNNPWFDKNTSWKIYNTIYGQHNRNWENIINFYKKNITPNHGKLFEILVSKIKIKRYIEYNSPFMGLMLNFFLKDNKGNLRKLKNLCYLIFNYLRSRQVAGQTKKSKNKSVNKSLIYKKRINLIKKKIKGKNFTEKFLLLDNSTMSWNLNDNHKSVNSKSFASELLNLKILSLNDKNKRKFDLFGIFLTLDHTFEPQNILNYALKISKYVIVYCHIDEKIGKQHLFSFTKDFLKYLNSRKIHTLDLTNKIDKKFKSPELYFLCSKNNNFKNFKI